MIMEKTEPTFVPEWLKNSGSSSLHSDDKTALKSLNNKSLGSDLGCPAASSYLRHTSSSNNSPRLRSYSSFGRSRDRDWDNNKEKTEKRQHDYSDLRRSRSNVSAKRDESWLRKLAAEKTVNNNGKISFERDFPSLGAEERLVDSKVGRVPSPVLSSAIQSLPVGSSGVIGGDVWTSALAEVPLMVGTNGPTSSVSATTNVAAGRNMAETLAHGHPRSQTAPQLAVETQRLEELAVKQSRQLIPMTPSMPKVSALNSSDKLKIKVGGQLQHQNSHILSPRPVTVTADITKTSSSTSSAAGKLHVLKPSRERNSTTPLAKETLSPTGGGKLPTSPLAAPLDRKPSFSSTLEKRPSPQAKSRNDFFNLMRKKSSTNSSLSPLSPDTCSTESANDKPGECGTQLSDENKVDSSCNACVMTEEFTKSRENQSRSDAILYSEEEEARFLKLLGWEETAEEEEGLTEEEINSFYRDVSKHVKLKTPSKCLMPLNLQMGKIANLSPDT